MPTTDKITFSLDPLQPNARITEKLIVSKHKSSVSRYMRSLHRDLGFLAIGFIFVYALSGIIMVYRDTDFLKQHQNVEKQLLPNLKPEELGKALKLREFKIQGNEGDIISFQNGTYQKSTGLAKYQSSEVVFPLNKFIELHKAKSTDSVHWFNVIFGVVLLFMSASSFWMFKQQSDSFRRGILFAIGGVLLTLILLLI